MWMNAHRKERGAFCLCYKIAGSINERYSVAHGVQEVFDLTLAIPNQYAKRKADGM
jgi:hypothetical protein